MTFISLLEKIVVGVILLILIFLVFTISSMDSEISDLMQEVEAQEAFVEQLEKDKKELIVEKNVLEVDNDALELDKSTLEKQLEEVQSKNLELERKLNSKKNEVSRSASDTRSVSNINTRGRLLGTFEATAYCKCTKCTGKWSNSPTASGTIPKEGRTIAVDPKIIPMGSKVKLDGKLYIAEDTGSAIKGRIVDIYYDKHSDALKFGRKYVSVEVIK